MTTIYINKTKLTVVCNNIEEKNLLLDTIGTAKEDSSLTFHCKTSINNLQRIKLVDHGAKSGDDTTRREIARLHDLYKIHNSKKLAIGEAKKGHATINFSFNFTPYKHQRIGFNVMHASNCAAIFGDCGIGKTALAAAFIESLVQCGVITSEHPAIIVCPISIIKHAWLEDIGKFTKDVKAVSVYEPSTYKRSEKRLARLATPNTNCFIVPYSLIRILEAELRQKRFRLVIVDESTKIKRHTTQTYRALKEVCWKSEYRYIMSGTPAPNGPLDLWSQFFFLDEGMTLEPSIVDFRHAHFKEIERTKRMRFWVPKKGSIRLIHNIIEPMSVRFKASECLDLPSQTFITRSIKMSKPQQKAYDEMSDNLFTELDSGETVTARVIVSKLMKLREITGGFVIDDDRHPVPIGSNPKLQELELLFDQILGDPLNKIVVWIQYQWEAKTIISKFSKKYGACGLYGAISQKQKDSNIDKFLNDAKTRVLVCHPQSAAHGLTLTVATYSIYYSLSHNFEDYYQSSKRIYRSGQTRPVFYYFLKASNSIDGLLLNCIQNKKNVQDLLVDGDLDPQKILDIRKSNKGATNGEPLFSRSVQQKNREQQTS